MKHLFFIGFVVGILQAGAQDNDKYIVEINLKNTVKDQVFITLYPPQSNDAYVEYQMAKVVPGTYDISDFGRFVTHFTAEDFQGNKLQVERLTTNRWKIQNEGALYKIHYRVHDTYDRFDGYGNDQNDVIFEPGGTNFDHDANVYVMNTYGLIGYLDGRNDYPYHVHIEHPENLYGATALERLTSSDTTDLFVAEDFNFLADSPIMYSIPDTVSRQIANARVTVSVYSLNKLVTAEEVMDKVYDLMIAQAAFLGGELPVDRYSYLIYLIDKDKLTWNFGALEHSYSTLFYLFEGDIHQIGQSIRDIAAHEFFHIVTPLNIHSEQIANFDYNDPEMSKHLWFYEGVVEYSSLLVQVKYGLYDVDTFIEELRKKIFGASAFPDISFTEMSQNILEPAYQDMFPNVYEKGTLIAMCLDLYLLRYSEGKYDLQRLIKDLSQKFGKSKSFKDDEFFSIIEQMTYPEIGQFLKTYVEGDTPLPLKEVLSWVGLEYLEEGIVSQATMGKFGVSLNDNDEIYVDDITGMNEFGRALGYKKGDIIKSINGNLITIQNAEMVIEDFLTSTKKGDKIRIEVKRKNKRGKVKTKMLKAKAETATRKVKHQIEFSEITTKEQEYLLRKWLTADRGQ